MDFDLNVLPPGFDLELGDGVDTLVLPLDEHGALNFHIEENMAEPEQDELDLDGMMDDHEDEFDDLMDDHEDELAGFDLNLEPEEDDDDGVMDLTLEEPQQGNVRHDTPEDLRKKIIQMLLSRSKDGSLGRQDIPEVSAHFGMNIRTVQRFWERAKKDIADGNVIDVSNRKRGRSGRKPIPVDLEPLRNIDLKERMTQEDVCNALGIGRSKLIRCMKKGYVRRHSSTIKPYLTPANKKARLQWCLDMLEPDSLPNDPRFKDLFDHVFIDEKWFFLTQKSENYYLLPDEDEPHRTCNSKNYIPRLMFLCVSARPRFHRGVCIFDGKIGIFPLVTFVKAKRSSRNRQAGTWEVKSITSITRDVMREFMIDKVLPAIRAKWPQEDIGKPVYVVQDNAPSHIAVDDPLFCEAAKQGGFDIRLTCQPPNSPDFNILDLGFFRAIQSIQYKKSAKTVEALVPVVQQAFHEYSPRKANKIWLSLQLVMMESMKEAGSNKYKIPHIQKDKLERLHRLPLQISCNASLVAEATILLAAMNN